jgi:hypothetical protein
VCLPITGCDIFNDQGGVDCNQLLDCCNEWADDADFCESQSAATCTTGGNDAKCLLNPDTNQCEGKIDRCCLPDEDPLCFYDPESGDNSLECNSTCSCEGIECVDSSTCGPGQSCVDHDANALTPNQCRYPEPAPGAGYPACEPEFEYCCVECGCQCRSTGN